MKESYSALVINAFSSFSEFRNLDRLRESCHPERSEGSQPADEPGWKQTMRFFGPQTRSPRNDSRDSTVEITRRRRRPLFPPAFPARSACSLPPCSSPAGFPRQIRHVLAPPLLI